MHIWLWTLRFMYRGYCVCCQYNNGYVLCDGCLAVVREESLSIGLTEGIIDVWIRGKGLIIRVERCGRYRGRRA